MIEYESSFWNSGRLVAGIDEAGRGALAGPVVAASVIANERLLGQGITDSKKLSKNKRKQLFNHIMDNATSVGVCFVSNDIIDEINILNATYLAMHGAIDDLQIKPIHILVDGNRFKKHNISHTTIIKGDSKSISIAAASIIAKVIRDKWMEMVAAAEFPNYFFHKNMGYGTSQHIYAIENYSKCIYHRNTFCKNILTNQYKLI